MRQRDSFDYDKPPAATPRGNRCRVLHLARADEAQLSPCARRAQLLESRHVHFSLRYFFHSRQMYAPNSVEPPSGFAPSPVTNNCSSRATNPTTHPQMSYDRIQLGYSFRNCSFDRTPHVSLGIGRKDRDLSGGLPWTL